MRVYICFFIVFLFTSQIQVKQSQNIYDCIGGVLGLITQVVKTITDIEALPIDIIKVVKDFMVLADDIKGLVSQCSDPFCLQDALQRCQSQNPQGCQPWGAIEYPDCKPGFTNAACCLCEANCPPGFTDNGLYCAKPAAYGRGAGYPWQFGDKAFDLTAAYNRCLHDNPELGCEKWGAIYYPKCKTNFHNVACCVCSPDCPSGWTDIGVSCQKPGTYGRGVGYPILPNDCQNTNSNQITILTDSNCDNLLSIVQDELQNFVNNQNNNQYIMNRTPILSQKMANYLQYCYNGN